MAGLFVSGVLGGCTSSRTARLSDALERRAVSGVMTAVADWQLAHPFGERPGDATRDSTEIDGAGALLHAG
ncbi:MAG: hypothetical protein ACXW3E_00740 [Thermoanaerobaculia bacterium]